MTTPFRLVSEFAPAGDQPQAIAALEEGVRQGRRDQVLLGVTGSGKTFTMAQLIANLGRPTLILAHNKTLAGQLYTEMRGFFPHNAVEYFVSYYDYYQPEAYVPRTDTYIEKDSQINEQIDRLRHAATLALLTRRDVIIVASVSCIYGLGSPESYQEMALHLAVDQEVDQRELLRRLVEIQFQRNDIEFQRGTFRVRGDTIEVFPAHSENRAVRLELFGDTIDRIVEIDPLTGQKFNDLQDLTFFPASHYVTQRATLVQAIETIKEELRQRLEELHRENRLLEAQRLEQRTRFDLEMLQELGYCTGIENYSRHLTGRRPGEPPPTLMEYLPADALLFVDESHVTVPQVQGMQRGDFSRKSVLVEYGFRLPSALDNRPLTFAEWEGLRPQTLFVSATPGPYELQRSDGRVVEQIIRPTGLTDPPCEVRPAEHQVDDLMHEVQRTVARGYRVLVTTLTKKMAENLTEYLEEMGFAVRYLHSDVDTLERMEIIRSLRLGEFQVLVGINLLREGLDIPEVGLVAILDADKEGFLRSETSLVQTIGRAARNLDGRAILYADRITGSMQRALGETERRRSLQQAYNAAHGITPASVRKGIGEGLLAVFEQDYLTVSLPEGEGRQRAPGEKGRRGVQRGSGAAEAAAPAFLRAAEGESAYGTAPDPRTTRREIKQLEKLMKEAAANLEFELAAVYRDRIKELEQAELLPFTRH